MKTVAITQSNYIPWKGTFDLIARVDELILLDSVQFTRRDWRTRNRIKTPSGPRWLSIPVAVRGHRSMRIADVPVATDAWPHTHWRVIADSYRRADAFARYAPQIRELYERAVEVPLLTHVNELFLRGVCGLLGIDTPISRDSDYGAADSESATERLVRLARRAGADRYLTGPSARAYLDESKFHEVGIDVEVMEYTGYPEYPQPHGPFRHDVSILDVLLCCGADARSHVVRAGAAA